LDQWIKTAQVVLQQRVDDPPVAPGDVLDDPGLQQKLEYAVANGGRPALRYRTVSGDRTGYLECVLMQTADLLHRLLHRRQVSDESRTVAEFDEVKVDVSAVELNGHEAESV